ncbi:hypothetical protein Taro_033426 [Colocasia esculenta]|uniref:Uncharacterized protein n=1 Tax=Colocasia esculenta TaxID=4460 RepID=A0A843W1J7_COLES|nr:hypothetical protein [Colocasia esculenta]
MLSGGHNFHVIGNSEEDGLRQPNLSYGGAWKRTHHRVTDNSPKVGLARVAGPPVIGLDQNYPPSKFTER